MVEKTPEERVRENMEKDDKWILCCIAISSINAILWGMMLLS